jgi:hypothetical protein
MFEGKPRIVSKIERAAPRRYGQMVSYFHAPYYVLHNDENENIPIIRYKRNKCDISLKIYPISLA